MEDTVKLTFEVSGLLHKKVTLSHTADAVPELLAGKLSWVRGHLAWASTTPYTTCC